MKKMQFRRTIFIPLVFGCNNGANQKLKAWSFRLRKNCFYMLNIERSRAHQNSITYITSITYVKISGTLLSLIIMNSDLKKFVTLIIVLTWGLPISIFMATNHICTMMLYPSCCIFRRVERVRPRFE